MADDPKVRILDRSAILGADDQVIERVPVPEWGGFVYLRNLTGAERDRYEADSLRYNKKGAPAGANLENARARLLVLAICDEAGTAILSPADLEALSKKNAKPIDRLFDRACELSGIGEQELAELAEGF
jgi:hypothetical protein